MVAEAVDSFVWAVRREASRDALAVLLAQLWRVPVERLRYLMALHKPAYEVHRAHLSIGRIALPLSPHPPAALTRGRSFAHTRHTLALMERVAACVRMREPTLLVGETGTGKTSVVQYLAESLGRKLLVHNLSEQVMARRFLK